MSEGTGIEWTDTTWNPVTGCTKVSAGCKNCYAEGVADRFWASQYAPVPNAEKEGPAAFRPRRFTDVQTHADRLDEPLRWRKPRKVFVNSMSDLFHDDVPDEFIDRVFAAMKEASPSVVRLGGGGFEQLPPKHVFQILTKRPERMRDYIRGRAHERIGASLCWPLSCVWLGVSCENQQAADERIPLLLQTPAAVRFLSCEPLLLGPLNLSSALFTQPPPPPTEDDGEGPEAGGLWSGPSPLGERGVSWVIAGGESGPGARPCDVAWIRSIVEQCKAAGVPCFVKQLGAKPIARDRWDMTEEQFEDLDASEDGWSEADGPVVLRLRDRKGGDPAEWAEDLRVREFPRENDFSGRGRGQGEE